MTMNTTKENDGHVAFIVNFSTGGALTVKNPEDQYYPNGIDRVFFTLPETVTLVDSEGKEYTGTPTWNETPLDNYDDRKLERQEFTISSSNIQLPPGLAANETPTATFKLIVAGVESLF